MRRRWAFVGVRRVVIGAAALVATVSLSACSDAEAWIDDMLARDEPVETIVTTTTTPTDQPANEPAELDLAGVCGGFCEAELDRFDDQQAAIDFDIDQLAAELGVEEPGFRVAAAQRPMTWCLDYGEPSMSTQVTATAPSGERHVLLSYERPSDADALVASARQVAAGRVGACGRDDLELRRVIELDHRAFLVAYSEQLVDGAVVDYEVEVVGIDSLRVLVSERRNVIAAPEIAP